MKRLCTLVFVVTLSMTSLAWRSPAVAEAAPVASAVSAEAVYWIWPAWRPCRKKSRSSPTS